MEQAISLSEFNRRIKSAVEQPALRSVWVMAETVDVRSSGGHLYMELMEKDAAGATVARMGASIWASNYARLNAKFAACTGANIASGMKVMVQVSATFHVLYGLRAVVQDINPEYTMGDLLRRRREILMRLQQEGVLEMNRRLPAPRPVLRVAVISARGAAGLGDFMHQIANNDSRLRFSIDLYEAVMQGDMAPRSIINALDRVAARQDEYDIVAIIRGGGSTSDLATLDDYDLAANVAQFPLPVLVGVGHERDVTVLDYVGWRSVKTPTAAAEWLIGCGKAELDLLRRLAGDTVRLSAQHVSTGMRRLEYIAGQLPQLATGATQRRRARLDAIAEQLPIMVQNALRVRRQRLDALAELMAALSPEATLRRGYSVLRINGHALTDPAAIAPDTAIEATLAKGTIQLVSK